jgi:hypothetical protein
VVGCEAHSFLDGYFGYHQISIVRKDIYKTMFIIDWETFIWRVMFFGMKNEPPTFQRTMIKTFLKYLDNFMKIFLNDFTLYSDIDALLGPGVNPLEGSPNVKLRKLGPKGTLPASNSRKG